MSQLTWPNILNGTNCEKPAVPNYKPPSKVDVIIIGGTRLIIYGLE